MPTRISAPAAARDLAMAQPYPLSSATPAIKALFPVKKELLSPNQIIKRIRVSNENTNLSP